MKTKGYRLVKTDEITDNHFVRKELNQDHAIYLGELISAGVEMTDPIEVAEVDGKLIYIDGRHRGAGYDLAGVKEVKVKVLEFDSETEMISYSYRANTGGSLPPTAADTEHTIVALLDRGEAKKRIGELLGLPASLARKYIDLVQSKTERQKVVRAAAAVRDGGLTAAKAAAMYDVDPAKLKIALGGSQKRKNGIEDARRNLTTLYKSTGQKNAALLRNLIEKYEDGDVSPKQVEQVFAHLERLQKGSARAVADWKKRFKARNSPAQSMAKAS